MCVAAVVPIAVYPSFKRFTHWPQVFLGLTFNLGALVGFAAVAGHITSAALLLYGGRSQSFDLARIVWSLTRVSSVFWTVAYDTLYAHQDKADDAKLGLRSTALWDTSNRLPVACSAAAAALWAAALAAHFHSPVAALVAIPAGVFAIRISRVGEKSLFLCCSLFMDYQMRLMLQRADGPLSGTCGWGC